MHRSTFLRNTGLLAGASLMSPTLFARLFQLPAYTIKPLRRNVSIFTERGGTIAIHASTNGYTIIDAQFPDTAKHLIDELKKTADKPFAYLLNTHHHGDHTGGNIAFKGLVNKVVAHENALKNLQAVAEKNKSLDKQLLPDTTFTDNMKIKLEGETIKAYYYGAGHTNGDAIYHFQKANIFHLGDLMFNKRHPFVDRTAGASMRNWIDVLEKVQKKASKDSIIIFGHALNAGEESGTVEDVKKFQDYLFKVVSFAEQEFKKGVSKAEFIKNTAIPGVTEWSGQGIERPLTAAYEEVSN